jgi:hypothetical protein
MSRVTITSRLSDEEALLVRIADSIGRSGLNPTSTLELIESWLEAGFTPGDYSDAASARFREQLANHGVDVEKLKVVISDQERFPHQWEKSDRGVAARMRIVREHVARLLPGKAAKHGEKGRGRPRDGIANSTHANSAPAIVRRLNRDRPDLAERVASGEISANAAAIESGYRSGRISIHGRDPRLAAQCIVRRTDPAYVEALIQELGYALGDQVP